MGMLLFFSGVKCKDTDAGQSLHGNLGHHIAGRLLTQRSGGVAYKINLAEGRPPPHTYPDTSSSSSMEPRSEHAFMAFVL